MARVAIGAAVVAIVVVAFATLFITPDGGDETEDGIPAVAVELVEPQQWVDQVCPVLAELNAAVGSTGGDQPDSAATAADREALQSYFARLFEEGSEESETAAVAVAEAGAPDAPGGRNQAEAVRRALVSARAELAEGAGTIRGLETADADEFQLGMVGAAGVLQDALTPLNEAVLALQADPVLGPLVDDEPGCSPT